MKNKTNTSETADSSQNIGANALSKEGLSTAPAKCVGPNVEPHKSSAVTGNSPSVEELVARILAAGGQVNELPPKSRARRARNYGAPTVKFGLNFWVRTVSLDSSGAGTWCLSLTPQFRAEGLGKLRLRRRCRIAILVEQRVTIITTSIKPNTFVAVADAEQLVASGAKLGESVLAAIIDVEDPEAGMVATSVPSSSAPSDDSPTATAIPDSGNEPNVAGETDNTSVPQPDIEAAAEPGAEVDIASIIAMDVVA